MFGEALDRFDEIRDQVIASFQLDIDIRPALCDCVLETHETVVGQNPPDQWNQDCDAENDQFNFHQLLDP